MRLRPGPVLAGLLGAAAVLRAGYLVAPIMDSDQATFGLQARHVLAGEFPVFSWGYAYIGTLQTFLDAAVFAVFGASRLVLNTVPLVLSLLLVVVVYRLGREVAGATVGMVAAALVAVAPPYLAIHGAWARHGYVDAMLLGTLCLLVTLRLARPGLPEREEVRLFAVLGLVGGLAWWTNFLSIFYLAPAALFLIWTDWRRVLRRGPWVALGLFLVGSAPFWAFNLAHAFWSFTLFGGGDAGRAPGQLVRVVIEGMPAILGARPSQSRAEFVPVLSQAVVVVYAAAFGWLAWRQLGRAPRPGLGLVLTFFLTAAVLVAVSRFAESITAERTKRYLLPLYSALPLLYAVFVADVRARTPRLGAGLLILPLTLHVYGNVVSYAFVNGDLAPYRQARANDEALLRFLHAHGLTRVYAPDYWLAPRLTFDAGESIVFAQPIGDRHPAYTELVDRSTRIAYVFAAGGAGDFVTSLRAIGATFARSEVGAYEVFHDFRPPAGTGALVSLPVHQWRGAASATRTPPARAFDRDVDTAWYSDEPQRPGLFFQLDLQDAVRVGKVVLIPPRPSIGSPRGYRIQVSRDGAGWDEVAAIGDLGWSLDWGGGQPRMGGPGRALSVFEPRDVRYVRIDQTGTDATLWWAIAEIFVYGPTAAGSARPTASTAAHLERGAADLARKKIRDAAAEYWQAARLEPALESAHAGLAAVYDEAGIPLEGATAPAVRAVAFEGVGLWGKAAREYEKEIGLEPFHRDHSGLWQRLLRAHREARARGEDVDEERTRQVEQWLGRAFSPSVTAAARFGDQIRLLGYELEPWVLRPGGAARLTYYWQALRSPPADYAVFVHFLRDGKILFQQDHAPLQGTYPTSRWQPGEVVRETLDLVTPAGVEAGSCEIVVGVWDPRSGRRLPVGDTSLPHWKDRVVIGRATIEARP
jgi:hypothetical protein